MKKDFKEFEFEVEETSKMNFKVLAENDDIAFDIIKKAFDSYCDDIGLEPTSVKIHLVE